MTDERTRAALSRWQTSSDEEEKGYWQTFTVEQIAETLEWWHDDHPDWNPTSTKKERAEDARLIYAWANDGSV